MTEVADTGIFSEAGTDVPAATVTEPAAVEPQTVEPQTGEAPPASGPDLTQVFERLQQTADGVQALTQRLDGGMQPQPQQQEDPVDLFEDFGIEPDDDGRVSLDQDSLRDLFQSEVQRAIAQHVAPLHAELAANAIEDEIPALATEDGVRAGYEYAIASAQQIASIPGVPREALSALANNPHFIAMAYLAGEARKGLGSGGTAPAGAAPSPQPQAPLEHPGGAIPPAQETSLQQELVQMGGNGMFG